MTKPNAPVSSATSSRIVWSVVVLLLIVLAYLTGTILFVALFAPVLVPVVVGLVRKIRGTEKPARIHRDHDKAGATMAGAAAALWIAAGAYLLAWRLLENDVPFRRIELVGGIGFGLMYALPGVLILFGFRRRLVLPSAVACGFVLAGMSFTLLPVFLILTLMTLWSFVRTQPERWVRGGLAAIAAVVLLGGSWAAHLSGDDPRCYSFTTDAAGRTTYTVSTPKRGFSGESSLGAGGPGIASGSGCTSDITTTKEGAISIILVSLIPVVAWVVAGPSMERRHAVI